MTVTVLPAPRTLAEIATSIHETQARMEQHLTSALREAIAIGHDLLEAQRVVPTGEFQEWCKANVNMAAGNVNNYMRLAEFEHLLPQEMFTPQLKPTNGRIAATRRAEGQITPALRYIRALGVRRYGKHQPQTPHAEIRRLVEGGMSKTEVAKLLGLHYYTVYESLLPANELKRRRNQRMRRRHERQAIVRRAEQAAAMRQASPDLSEAYSLIRKCLQHAQSAHDTYRAGNARKTVASAIGYLHKAEDALARAHKAASIEGES